MLEQTKDMKTRNTLILCAVLLAAAAHTAGADEIYKVRKGDNISRIAKRFHVKAESITEANGLAFDRLMPGTKLTIPGVRPKAKPTATKAEVSEAYRRGQDEAGQEGRSLETQLHKVEKGETLSSIAEAYGMTAKELKKLNHIRRVRKLKAGVQLVVHKPVAPAPEETASASPPPSVPADGQIARKLRELGESPVAKEIQELAGVSGKQGGGLKENLIEIARKMLDIPYRFGGTSLLGIDCSGYVQKVFSLLDIALPRTAREQFRLGKLVGREDLSIGDLVFFRTYAKFPSHVGIYLGDNRFIHASSTDRKVTIDSLDAPYYFKRFIGARRLDLGEPGEEI